MSHNHGLKTSSIGLKIRVNPKYFENGVLQVKCVATVSPTMWNANSNHNTNNNNHDRIGENIVQQQLKQYTKDEQIPLPSIDTREAVFLGEFLEAPLCRGAFKYLT